jgi:methylated-DNA-[protein]-cysteine S-methyltransferase
MLSEVLFLQSMNSFLGELFVLSCETKIRYLQFDLVDDQIQSRYKIVKKKNSVSAAALSQLSEYFNRKRKSFDLPISSNGTDFQKKVWQSLLQIPYGETISYSTQAKMIGVPNSCRAVGNANGKNPLPILIPCHRVISSSGALGGFSAGLKIKESLLKFESNR